MTDQQQIVGVPSNMPLTFTSPSSSLRPSLNTRLLVFKLIFNIIFAAASTSLPARPPLNTPLTSPTSSSRPRSNRGQEEHFAPLHAVIISLITAIGGYVLFQFENKGLSLFDEHGNIMRAAFVMLFVYVMAFMAEFRLQNQSNYFAIMKQFSPLSGLLVVVLLLFILSLFLGLAASIIWAFLVVGPTFRLFQQIIQSLRGIIRYIPTDRAARSNLLVEESDPLGIL